LGEGSRATERDQQRSCDRGNSRQKSVHALPPRGSIRLSPKNEGAQHGPANYLFLFDLLDQIGCLGWIGCECRIQGDTVVGVAETSVTGLG
jgi:hydroxypyruvate isomerase